MLLYNWLSAIYCTPGPESSNLIRTENAVPNKPENKANIKYKVPMSLALLDKNQRSSHRDKDLLISTILPVWYLLVVISKKIKEVIIKKLS